MRGLQHSLIRRQDEFRVDQAFAFVLGMISEPADIAAIALVAASPAGRFLTATTLVVDGGEMSTGPFG